MQTPIPAHIRIIYDGIGSSVFPGQVLAPLKTYQKESSTTSVYIVSFEYARDYKAAYTLIEKKFSGMLLEKAHVQHTIFASTNNTNKNCPPISFILFKKYPFIGSLNLSLAAYQLKKFLRQLPSYTISARGPIAGAIAVRAAHTQRCQELVIQARGLVAAEYAYDQEQKNHKKKPWGKLRAWIHHLRAQQFEKLEKKVYALRTQLPATIECVSPALKTYLIQTFHAPAVKITIAQHDIPPLFTREQLETWKKEVRRELAIPEKASVYCYSGSVKPWQCPDLTIDFFARQLQNNPENYLLILTQEKDQFEKLLAQSSIAPKNYRIFTVAHDQVYRYLAACDMGILFRRPHVVNWVSRPTKALEYRAAGLAIAHNNTVAYLQDQSDLSKNMTTPCFSSNNFWSTHPKMAP